MTGLEEARRAAETSKATYASAIKTLAEQIADGIDDALNTIVREVVRTEADWTKQMDPADIAILKVNLGSAIQAVEQRLRSDGAEQIKKELDLLGKPARQSTEVIGAASRVLENLTTPFNELLIKAGFEASVGKAPYSNRKGYALGALGLEDYPLLNSVALAAHRAATARTNLLDAEKTANADDAMGHWDKS